jgi:hypothetical protein
MAARSKPEPETGKAGDKPDPKKPGPKTGTKKPKPEPDRASQATNLPTKGHPRRFRTEQDYQQCFIDYIEHCAVKQLLPNISGFCVFADITRETFYLQQDYYLDTHKKIRQALEDALINHNKFGQSNPAMAIVQGKNTFKWDDTGKGGGDNSALLDVDFDANQGEIDVYLSKLGYFALPDPDS